MVWCSWCLKNVQTGEDSTGSICCQGCGKVIQKGSFSDEPTFVKNSAGQSTFSGNITNTVPSYQASQERILNTAREGMYELLDRLGETNTEIIMPALNFYRIAVERSFTKGRKRIFVEAACLYIACREKKKPYLLIDFSLCLGKNVYELGAVFLQLCKLLSLEEHPIVQKPLDPSLFIHRFANRLLEDNYMGVANTALRIIASMKRDWMQTGRKPSGLCGAALYVSALLHGHRFTKTEIVRIVHVCEATLTKRLIEFENTESGSLTIEEFNRKAKELESEKNSVIKQPSSGTSEMLCGHKDSGKSPIAHGLCESCYDEFMTITGGLDGGSEPPAFQRAVQGRMAGKSGEEGSDDSPKPCQEQSGSKNLNMTVEKDPDIVDIQKNQELQSKNSTAGPEGATKQVSVDNGPLHETCGVDDTDTKAFDESESLSDIDDVEVDAYLHSEEEKHYKKIIWEEMNKEYIQEQAAKEAAAASAKEAYEASLRDCPGDIKAAQELAAAAAAAVAKSRKEKQQKRAMEARNSTPAQTAAEATRQMLDKKRLSSKINYDVLEKLFNESEAPEKLKKSRTESGHNHDVLQSGVKEFKSEEMHKVDKLREEDEYDGVGDMEDEYANGYYHETDGYDYHDDYAFDDY